MDKLARGPVAKPAIASLLPASTISAETKCLARSLAFLVQNNGQSVPVCAERLRLMERYHEKVSLYCTTLHALDLARPTASATEYKRMAGYVEQCRQHSEGARLELENHLADHKCAEPALAYTAQ